MKCFRLFAALVLVVLSLAASATLRAAEPEPLSQKVFDVQVEGRVVEVSFALALSELSNYPVTITAISGPLEEVLWEGVLAEGFYRLRAPLVKITSGALKVVLKTKVTNRTAQGAQSFLRYQVWEGTLN